MSEEVVAGADPAPFRAETAVLRQPNASGLTAEDLLESAAELESARLTYATLAGVLPSGSPALFFQSELHAAYPDASHPRRKAFDRLAGLAGVEAAYELLALITFLVFIGEDPAGMFDQLAPAVANQADGFAALSAAQTARPARLGRQLRGVPRPGCGRGADRHAVPRRPAARGPSPARPVGADREASPGPAPTCWRWARTSCARSSRR